MWKDEFVEILQRGSFTAAKDFKNQFFPKKLYKYRALNANTLSNITSDTVWVSTPLTMNDPYECSTKVDYDRLSNFTLIGNDAYWETTRQNFIALGLTEEDLERVRASENPIKEQIELLKSRLSEPQKQEQRVDQLEQFAMNRLDKLNELFIKFLKSKLRICSFSERNDSLLMWSHYSDHHSGICVEYDLDNSGNIKDNIYPALYTDYVFDATGYFTDKSKTIYISLLSGLYKAIDWQYEYEWRFTMPNGLMKEDGNIRLPKPIAIYFGSEIETLTDPDKKGILTQIVKYADDNSIPKFKMKLERSEFKMAYENFKFA